MSIEREKDLANNGYEDGGRGWGRWIGVVVRSLCCCCCWFTVVEAKAGGRGYSGGGGRGSGG